MYVLQRANKLSEHVQRQLVTTILSQSPDLCILSGDLTNLSTREEFQFARQLLEPLLNNGGRFPVFIVPGNHDAYTASAVEDQRGRPVSAADSGTRGVVAASLMREFFGPWMESMPQEEIQPWQYQHNPEGMKRQIERQQQHFMRFDPNTIDPKLRAHSSSSGSPTPMPYLPVFGFDFLRIIGLNPCRPTWLHSNGAYESHQMDALQSLLLDQPKPTPGAFDAWHQIDPQAQMQRRMQRMNDASNAAQSSSSPSSSSSSPSVSTPLPFSSTYNLLVGHYPILDGHGRPYELGHPWHGVANGPVLRSLLLNRSNRIHPHMFLHGHVHRGFQDQLGLETIDPEIPAATRHMITCNPGSSGQAFSARKKRCAAFNLYTITRGGDARINTDATIASESSSSSSSSSSSPLPRRAFPFPQPPPPFPVGASQSPASISDSPFQSRQRVVDPAGPTRDVKLTGARGGVQSIAQASANKEERYYTNIERFIHNGEEFVQEEFPYTSGF